jgi:hypothetical protein
MRLRIVCLASSVLIGCGGSFATSDSVGDGGGGGDAGTHDASPPGDDAGPLPDGGSADSSPADASPPWSPSCPASTPALGSSCSVEGVACEYGDAWWNVACDPVVQCQGGVWTTYELFSFAAPCSPEPGPNPSSCPATEGDVSQGSVCSDTSLSCVYAQGVCSCQVSLGGPILIDGGQHAYWGCLPESGCPWPRPRLGTACVSSEAMTCTYEACAYGQGCDNGLWQPLEEGCAAAQNGGGP